MIMRVMERMVLVFELLEFGRNIQVLTRLWLSWIGLIPVFLHLTVTNVYYLFNLFCIIYFETCSKLLVSIDLSIECFAGRFFWPKLQICCCCHIEVRCIFFQPKFGINKIIKKLKRFWYVLKEMCKKKWV